MPAPDIVWWAALAKKLNILALLTYLVPSAVGLWRWSGLVPAYRPLVWLVVGPGFLLGLASEIGRYVFHNNIAPQHLITLTETLVLGWAYWYALHSARNRRFLMGALGGFIVVFGVESVYWRGFWQGYNTYAHTFQTFVLLALALLYFEQLLQELHTSRLEHDPMFLVSVGTMLYYAGTIMVFLLEDGMQHRHQTDQLWAMFSIQATLLIVFNGFLTLALWNAHRAPQVSKALL
ncbi:hypothetical protein GCM10022408_34740 [Hymenobacter fastidiosus]|uniref:Uncharacterized protein n=1 Tax=Hymenobacter fastidiosus TaxID=486264 RepID=A0ABP7SXS2_9BACT